MTPAWLTARPIAHRGLHDRAAGRLENTLPAFEAAARRGFSIECDVQLSADGEIVVFHDDTLDRLTGASGPVAARSLGELQAIRFKGSDAHIPSLAELAALVDGAVPLVVELKSDGKADGSLPEKVAALLAGYRGPAAVMSFDPHAVGAMRRLAPERARGLISYRYDDEEVAHLSAAKRFALRHLLMSHRVGAEFVAYHVKALPALAPLLLRRLGLPLLTWTVRTEADRAVARRWADQIIFEDYDPDAPPPA